MIRASKSLLLLAVSAAPALADFTNPFTPAWRGAPDTEFARWETFTSAFGAANLPDVPGSTSVDASLLQIEPSAFLTAGNIYSFSAPLRCRLTDTVETPALRVMLQTSTRGVELDYASVVLVHVDSLGVTHSLPWTQRTELARTVGMGVDVESLFEWELGALGWNISSYELRFDAGSPSLSLDALILDVQHAPAPIAYCTAKTNSLGCTPSISGFGLPSASAGSGFVIESIQMRNNKAGVMFYSNGGRAALAFGGGTLCVGGAIKRVGGLTSGGTPAPANDCSGVFSVDLNAFRAGALGGNPSPFLSVVGTTVNSQFWGRDPGFAAPFDTQLSDAIEHTVGP